MESAGPLTCDGAQIISYYVVSKLTLLQSSAKQEWQSISAYILSRARAGQSMGMWAWRLSHSLNPACGHFLPGMCRVACGSLDYATLDYPYIVLASSESFLEGPFVL